MVEVLVWLLVIGTHDEGLDARLVFKSDTQCQHVLKQVKESNIRYLRGSCIQANILVPK